MLKVRFPNGQCITYDNANYCVHRDNGSDLYEKKCDKKTWVATVPHSCIIESQEACKVENPIIEMTEQRAFDIVLDMAIKNRTNCEWSYLKKLLKNYNAIEFEWKNNKTK